MLASLSRGGSRIGKPYTCSSCLSNLLAHSDPQFARLPANRVIQTASFASRGGPAKDDVGEDSKKPAVGKKARKLVRSTAALERRQRSKLTRSKSALEEDAPDTTDGSKTKDASGASEKKTRKSSKSLKSKQIIHDDVDLAEAIEAAKALQPTKPTKPTIEDDIKLAVEAAKAMKPTKTRKSKIHDDIELAEAIEAAKAVEPKKPEKPKKPKKAAKGARRPNPNPSKRALKRMKESVGEVQESKGKAAPAIKTPKTQPGDPDIAAQIKTHIGTHGGDSARNALVQAIQAKVKTTSKREQAEILTKLRKTVSKRRQGLSIKKLLSNGLAIEKHLSIREAMASRKRAVVRMVRGAGTSTTVTQVRKILTGHEIDTLNASSLELVPIKQEELKVPSLSYGLERVLFNPGVYQLQDPRSRVFNFDPYLQTIMPVNEFDFTLLKKFVTSSRDKTLLSTAAAEKKKYTGSTSSMTSTLSHFHYLLSQWRPINVGNMSKSFPATLETFTMLHRAPIAMFLRYKDGVYAIDADKEFDTANVLSMLGQSMEKLLTLSTEEYEQYRKHSTDPPSEEERSKSEAYHYTTLGDFLMRSQLDAHDPRVPGTGMFDLKTRAVVSIRMDIDAYEQGSGYEIRSRHGEWESYEREYYDMIRSAFLKYSLQVRMGRMDGIFVAFHNIARIFGFQYISLPEMDYALHGADDTTTGDAEFKLSLSLLNRVLDRATARFPEKSIRLFFETRPKTSEAAAPYMYIFAEPVDEQAIEAIQTKNKKKIDEFEQTVLGLHRDESEEEEKEQWENLQAKVQASIDSDEFDLGEVDAESNGSEQDGVDPSASDFEFKDVGEVEELDEETQHDNLEEGESEPEGVEADEIIDEDVTTQDHENEVEKESSATKDEEALEDEESGKEEDIIDEDVMTQDQESEVEKESSATRGEEATLEDEESGKEEDIIDEDASGESEESVSTDTREPELVEMEDLMISEPTEEDMTTATESSSPNPEEDALVEDMMAVTKGGKPILAMYLTIRNKVNGDFVERPNNLKPEDEWKLEYSLAEIPDAEKAHTLLKASRKRRHEALTKDHRAGNARNDDFLATIKAMSDRGRLYRKEIDNKEKKEPKKVFGREDVE
ncbi:mRNA degradation protein, mitochondrial [Lachnellula occidentalis]|uniref:mRNA degradation protein, mitochondrial n=1 Tax=Lachnellula occidentalis TaxID=215460 RepID=A0A8H8S6T6_9HELO|nr:mRNA degradation protein, mitochondrial [Lachnellula occidentalis]